jgi:hypothetical protein
MIDQIIKQAREELKYEEFREQVDKAKARMRAKKRHRFPWRLAIINLNKTEEEESNG